MVTYDLDTDMQVYSTLPKLHFEQNLSILMSTFLRYQLSKVISIFQEKILLTHPLLNIVVFLAHAPVI